MHASPAFVATALLLASASSLATPVAPHYNTRAVSTPQALTVPLTRRNGPRTAEAFLRKAQALKAKYAKSTPGTKAKRSNVAMTNEEDSEFYGSISVGTPSTTYSVVLDTGSADLLLATSPCTGCETTTPLYTPSDSSTSVSSSTKFSITYGSGDAAGTLAQDTVTIGGYTVSNQIFAACDTMDDIVTGSISGLLGLGWTGLASSGAVPLVQALAQNGSLPAEEFGFAFTTYSAETDTSSVEPGGTMTIGGTDTSLYSGSINWVDIILPASYWSIPLQGISVGGTSLGITADAVVVDSGTSLIGAPEADVAAIYAQIPGSAAINLDGESGYYEFSCSTSTNVSFTFGGVAYSIPSANFNGGYVDTSGKMCLGAIFVLDTSSSIPWIVGDSFLVGVYSAFRFSDPPAVGFASLGSGGTSSSSSGTTSTSSSSESTSAASPSVPGGRRTILAGLGATALVTLLGMW